MNKIKRTYWLRPELVAALEEIQGKLEHPPAITTLVESAIEALAAHHKVKVEKPRREART